MGSMTCKFCIRTDISARGMCALHYQRWKRTGNPEISQQGQRQYVPIEQRMAVGYVVLDNGCHQWIRGISNNGYGRVSYHRKDIGAHRVSWWLSTGSWPVEELDHLCHTLDTDCPGGVECMHRRCINPNHLEEVSRAENTRRRDLRIGLDVASRQQKETIRKESNICGNGHEYTAENTRITKRGHRVCKACEREYSRRYRNGNV